MKNSKNISIKELIAEKAIYLVFIILLVAIVVVEQDSYHSITLKIFLRSHQLRLLLH